MKRSYCVSKKVFAFILEEKDGKVRVDWGNPRVDPDREWYPSEDFEILRTPRDL